MTDRRPRVAVLGGGMGGLAAAWRLSEPGWRRRFDRIVVYQRGWRLGGKGASSRGRNGRIEEHGLHLWLGFYENAFRLVRECYAELDRPTNDPGAPILTWTDAFEPVSTVGVADGWHQWLARFSPNDLRPGDPDGPAGTASPLRFAERAVRLLLDIAESLGDVDATPSTGRVVLSPSADPAPAGHDTLTAAARVVGPSALRESARLVQHALDGLGRGEEEVRLTRLIGALDRSQAELAEAIDTEPGLRHSWHVVSLTLALVRGLAADRVLTEPHRLAELDDEDYRDWIARHGAAPEAVDGPFLRGLYDLVVGYEDGDRSRPRFAAGTALLLAMKLALEYKGAAFWRMRAGMGDVVFAPLYQALRQRGVDFEFFHRVDRLHIAADRTAVDAISVARQVRLADGLNRYEPLVRVRGLPCFPSVPLADQLADGPVVGAKALERQAGEWRDTECRLLRRGVDFDAVVLAVPPPMATLVAGELLDHRPEWRAMVHKLGTVATHAFQLWLREPETALGWPRTGTTLSGLGAPFDTWASMPQLIDAEDWPSADRPRAIAYFCGAMAAAPPPDDVEDATRRAVVAFLDRDLRSLLPGAVDDEGFRWDLLCAADGLDGPAALDSQFWTANVDPSDRYVQALPGTGRYRLRPDESGYDNLVLAGDWTDSGLNAGCIEAAVLSGLQAANALTGHARQHRVVGYLPG